MIITLAYSWSFTLLLILINIFQIDFLLSKLSFNLAPSTQIPSLSRWRRTKTKKREMAHIKKKKEEREEEHRIYKKEKYRV